jgi:hypothetical protein
MAKLTKIYGMYDKPQDKRSVPGGLVEEYISPGGHDYRPDLRVAVFRFFNKHLKGDTTAKVEDSAKYTPLQGRDLRVFPEDADVPKDALNGRIDETFIAAAKVKLPEKGKFAEWKKEVIAKFKAASLRFDPEKIPAATIKVVGNRFQELESEKGILCSLSYITGVKRNEKQKYGAFWSVTGDFQWNPTPDFFEVGFDGRQGWTHKSPPNYVERSHALLGNTIDERRLLDFLAAFRSMDQKLPWAAVGVRQGGVLAAYAALFEPSIKEVIVIDPPKSHKEEPYFLNVMRVLDIPETLGLLAPTPLTIIGGNDPAFDRTAEIYRVAGAADKLKRK